MFRPAVVVHPLLECAGLLPPPGRLAQSGSWSHRFVAVRLGPGRAQQQKFWSLSGCAGRSAKMTMLGSMPLQRSWLLSREGRSLRPLFRGDLCIKGGVRYLGRVAVLGV